jgi:hypothetical protein
MGRFIGPVQRGRPGTAPAINPLGALVGCRALSIRRSPSAAAAARLRWTDCTWDRASRFRHIGQRALRCRAHRLLT